MTRAPLERIIELVLEGEYALRPHAVTHMLSEGFGEPSIVNAVMTGQVLECYPEEDRCLIVGTFAVSESAVEYLHVVIDYWVETSDVEWVDIVTAYVPRRPYWQTPRLRGRKGQK